MSYEIAVVVVAVVWFVAGYALARAIGAICHDPDEDKKDDEAGA